MSAWRGAREDVDARRDNWVWARPAELKPSLPGAVGIMRSGSWFLVSLEGPSLCVDLPQAPEGGQRRRRGCAKCLALSHQTLHSAPGEEEPRSHKDGSGQGQRARRWLRDRERGVCACTRTFAYARLPAVTCPCLPR